ncbi:MAG: ribosome maturation factor RimM [Deltaproteobacteria bacterium]|nr:ribosome maturation factor RimM [Deltaproteobacteria bacterium]
MELLEIGKIVRPHGISGRMKVLSHLELQDALSDLPEVSVGRKVREAVVFSLEAVQASSGAFILKLKGIEDRDTAAGYAGSSIWIASDKLKPLPEGEYYWRDIIGMQAVTEEGEALGRIESVFPTGSNDVYVCRQGKKEILLPAIEEVIRKIDTDRKVMVVRLLEGLEPS